MRRGLRKYERQTVIVHGPGPSIRGVLLSVFKDCLVLAHATHLDGDQKLAGEVVVPLTAGVWIQVAPAPEVTR